MLSLGMAAKHRGVSGEQLPTPFYPSLERAGIRFWRSQLCLVVGPGSAGKSLLISNLVAQWSRPTLAFLLDQDQATAAARFAATETNEPFLDLKKDLDSPATTRALARLGFIQTDFRAEELADVQLQLDAFIERYGVPPEVLVIDNLGNMASSLAEQWDVLKALTLELDVMARNYEMLVIAAAHTKDAPTTEPMPRSSVLGQLHQYPRLMLSVAYNSYDGVYKLAAVKNSSGATDAMAMSPIAFDANPANMQVTELAAPLVNRSAEHLARFRASVNGD
jgi:AAA domain